MRNELLFIDTNVVMYARGKEHQYRASCGRIILEIAAGSFRENFGIPLTDTEVFQEILYRYALVGKWETGISVCRDLFTLGLDILPIGSGEVKKMGVVRDGIVDVFDLVRVGRNFGTGLASELHNASEAHA